jgi:hypothetical protein
MYVVTWLDHRNEGFPNQWQGDIFAARVSPRGRVIDVDGFAIADSSTVEETPAVAGANGMTVFAYTGFNPQPPFANLRLTLRTLTGPPTPWPGPEKHVAASNISVPRQPLSVSRPVVERAPDRHDHERDASVVHLLPRSIRPGSDDWLDFFSEEKPFHAVL